LCSNDHFATADFCQAPTTVNGSEELAIRPQLLDPSVDHQRFSASPIVANQAFFTTTTTVAAAPSAVQQNDAQSNVTGEDEESGSDSYTSSSEDYPD
jgi:hypothetical protein